MFQRHLLRTRAFALIICALFVCIVQPAVARPQMHTHENVTSFVLANGMKVVVIEDHRAPVITHMVWYKVGAADEPWGQSGIAHFFEHLMFKGTKTIPPGEFSKIIARNGGRDNAFTSHDYTAYFQRIAADRLEIVMEMEADRMQNLTLDTQSIETERQVVLEERKQRVDNSPAALLNEQLDAAFYRNHPYGMPIIGWQSEIEALTKAQLLDFYKQHYAPDQATLVVAGDVTPENALRLAQTYYGPIPPSGAVRSQRPTEPMRQHDIRQKIIMTDTRVGQPYVVQSYLVPSMVTNMQEAAALSLVAQLLDGDATGQLYGALENQQVAIDSGAIYRGMTRGETEFSIYGVPTPETDVQDVQETLEQVIVDFTVTQEALDRAKQVFLNDLIYQKDSQVSQAYSYGMALSIGLDVQDVQSWPEIIESMTVEDIQTVAKTYLIPARSTTGWLMQAEATQ